MQSIKQTLSDVVTAVNKLDFRATEARKASALKLIDELAARVAATETAKPKPSTSKPKAANTKKPAAKPRTSSATKLEQSATKQSLAKQGQTAKSASPIGAVTKADKAAAAKRTATQPKAATKPAAAKPRTKAEAEAMGLKVVAVKQAVQPKPKAANTPTQKTQSSGLAEITKAMEAVANAVGANARRIESLEQRVARIEAEQLALQDFNPPF